MIITGKKKTSMPRSIDQNSVSSSIAKVFHKCCETKSNPQKSKLTYLAEIWNENLFFFFCRVERVSNQNSDQLVPLIPPTATKVVPAAVSRCWQVITEKNMICPNLIHGIGWGLEVPAERVTLLPHNSLFSWCFQIAASASAPWNEHEASTGRVWSSRWRGNKGGVLSCH